MKKASNWGIWLTRIILLIGFVWGVGYTLNLFSVNTLTNRETTLLGVVLTICSTIASWLVTHIYAAKQTEQAVEDVQERSAANLKMYALKASEKVNNLSNELGRLATYLQEELEWTDYANPQEAIRGREERIESAVHIIRTLKSVNDTSLSDWEGVIGDELDEQREERMEREKELGAVIQRAASIIESHHEELAGTKNDSVAVLRSDLDTLKGDLRRAIVELGGPTARATKRKDTLETVCPGCGAALKYRQRVKVNSCKAVKCEGCNGLFLSRCTKLPDGDIAVTLEKREHKEVSFACLSCGGVNLAKLDTAPHVAMGVACTTCSSPLKIVRSIDGKVSVKAVVQQPKRKVLDEASLGLIKDALPQQPWDEGIHKKVASTLGFSSTFVQSGIQELIKRGVFFPQFNGVVYRPAERRGDVSVNN
jgi:hypothetical protein